MLMNINFQVCYLSFFCIILRHKLLTLFGVSLKISMLVTRAG